MAPASCHGSTHRRHRRQSAPVMAANVPATPDNAARRRSPACSATVVSTWCSRPDNPPTYAAASTRPRVCYDVYRPPRATVVSETESAPAWPHTFGLAAAASSLRAVTRAAHDRWGAGSASRPSASLRRVTHGIGQQFVAHPSWASAGASWAAGRGGSNPSCVKLSLRAHPQSVNSY